MEDNGIVSGVIKRGVPLEDVRGLAIQLQFAGKI